MTMTARRKARWSAVLLLAVFALGGLVSPLVHRVSHVHEFEHRHGAAAADFSTVTAGSVPGVGAVSVDFLVEERTPFEELSCDLCARLSLSADEAPAASTFLLSSSSIVRSSVDVIVGRRHVFSRIRAPPFVG